MESESLQIKISDSLGSVSAEVMTSGRAEAIITLAHGAGAGMHHAFMIALASDLASAGIATMRFNFPYMEQGKRRPDVPAVAHKTVEMVIQKTHELFPDIPLFASGKSFGGRMSSQYLANNYLDFVKGIIFFGFPLHPAGKPAIDRAEHLKAVKVPMLFLQGTRDELAELNLIEDVTHNLPLATLFKIEGADHSFKAGKKDVVSMLTEATKEWIEKLSK